VNRIFAEKDGISDLDLEANAVPIDPVGRACSEANAGDVSRTPWWAFWSLAVFSMTVASLYAACQRFPASFLGVLVVGVTLKWYARVTNSRGIPIAPLYRLAGKLLCVLANNHVHKRPLRRAARSISAGQMDAVTRRAHRNSDKKRRTIVVRKNRVQK